MLPRGTNPIFGGAFSPKHSLLCCLLGSGCFTVDDVIWRLIIGGEDDEFSEGKVVGVNMNGEVIDCTGVSPNRALHI